MIDHPIGNMYLEFRNVSTSYGDFQALDNLILTPENAEETNRITCSFSAVAIFAIHHFQ